MTSTEIQNPIITKPLLAGKLENAKDASFPCFVTPKLDGIRALRVKGDLVSRTFKPIRNQTIRELLTELLPEGSDGEIMDDGTGTFQDVTSMVMSVSGGKDFTKRFTYYWFDYVKDNPGKGYLERIKDMEKYIQEHGDILAHPQAKIVPLYPLEIFNEEELTAYEEQVLKENFEGVMIRKSDGKYKMGRSTLKEGILLKLKQFSDAEATVIAVHEQYHNENEKEKNEFGGSKRSTRKEGLIPAGKLGALEVINDAGEKFSIGSGFTDEQRKEFWERKEELIRKTVKYSYFITGSKNAPRFPVFQGFRDPDDL